MKIRFRRVPISPPPGEIGTTTHNQKKRWRWGKRLVFFLFSICVIAILFDRIFPLPLPDTSRQGGAIVLARDGTPLRAFADASGIWRYPVIPEQVS